MSPHSVALGPALLLLGALGWIGCASGPSGSPFAGPEVPVAPTALDQGAAVVLFAPPGTDVPRVPLFVDGGVVAWIEAGQFAVVPVAAGAHVFGTRDGHGTLRAELEQGRLYFVEVVAGTAGRPGVRPFTLQDPRWGRLGDWLASSEPVSDALPTRGVSAAPPPAVGVNHRLYPEDGLPRR